ncbi:tRNA (guanosine(37)-N1)-methyltransferase TrmD [Rickettsiales bacterium (ex Bugula neritina AB1)]|nr:tRNA (guanosine(37)-N1)-methyltransferase TrmD [Rickettsiales bacterium (ex Bugula neritina AB1)]
MCKLSISIATIFPEAFGILKIGIVGGALKKNFFNLNIIDLKDFDDKKRVDDKPFGGIPGMVIKASVIEKCVELQNWTKIFYTSTRGITLNQRYFYTLKSNLNENENILIICGRYEGIDERTIYHYKMIEISIGDFILAGGEIVAAAFVEALIRLLPKVIGNQNSLEEESFINNDLQYCKYTRPRVWKNYKVPEVLLEGNHKKIEEWKKKNRIYKNDENKIS